MQYKIINGGVYYGSDMILENINIEINDGEKIAVVGRNGCGKTTLLKAIAGEVALDSGTDECEFRVINVGARDIAYLKQTPFADDSAPLVSEVRKIFSELIEMEERINSLLSILGDENEQNISEFSELNERYIALGGLTYKKEYTTMLRRFGFTEEDENRPVGEFSGGQRTKIAFIKILLSKPDILLLDEPTNHLDIETVKWLEEYLKNYKSTLVIVSHDRMFLDRIVNKVYEIEWGETRCYKGDYSSFERQKRENYIKQQKDSEMQKAEIERLTKLIERFRYKASKAKMVQSKIKLLEHMKIIAEPNRYNNKTYKTHLEPKRESSRRVLDVNGLQIGYDSPLATVSFRLEKGNRLGIIGGNGIGKSTLLKTLMGVTPALSGSFTFGFGTDVAYFDQQLAQINGNETVFDSFSAAFPELNDTEVRLALGAFLFSGDDVFHSVSSLSGGEKVRLALCKIFQTRPNVLILDEPTNHMDIIGKETLENILSEFAGTVIFVSHDRYFVRKIADRLLVFHQDGAVYFDGTFDDYEQKVAAAPIEDMQPIETRERDKKPKQKYISPLRELEKKKRRAEKIEKLLEENEQKIAAVSCEMESDDVCTDYQKVLELQTKLDELLAQKELFENEWLELQEQITK